MFRIDYYTNLYNHAISHVCVTFFVIYMKEVYNYLAGRELWNENGTFYIVCGEVCASICNIFYFVRHKCFCKVLGVSFYHADRNSAIPHTC